MTPVLPTPMLHSPYPLLPSGPLAVIGSLSTMGGGALGLEPWLHPHSLMLWALLNLSVPEVISPTGTSAFGLLAFQRERDGVSKVPCQQSICGALAGLGAWSPGAPLPHPVLLTPPYEIGDTF